MKILHLTTHLNSGGITLYILRLVDALRAHGIELQIVSSGGEYEYLFREKGVKVHNLNIRTKSELHPKLYLSLPHLNKILRREGIQLMHAHTRVTQVMASWSNLFTKIPVITTCHGFYKRRLGRRLHPAWGQRTIAISDLVAAHLREDFQVPAKSICMINNAVDLQELEQSSANHDPAEVRRKFGFGQDDPVLGIVARLVEDKGHAYLVNAVEELRREYPTLRCLIVGAGRERERLEADVKERQLEEHILFTGNVLDVTEPLSAIDIFTFPATWREGFGLSIVEAMALGKPVIVSNIWALNSLIQHGKTGLLIEPKSTPALCESIRNLLKDREMASRLGKTARQLVMDNFTLPRMAREMSTVYLAESTKA